MGTPLLGPSPRNFERIFDEAILSSTALVNSITTNPDFWLKNLKALQQAFSDLTTTNNALTAKNTTLQTRVNDLENTNDQIISARAAATANHDALNQALGGITVYKDRIAELTEQLRLAQSNPAPTPTHTPNHPDPEKFSGDRTEFETWVIQVNVKMTRNADHFVFAGQDTVQNEMFYVISRLDGDAFGHVQPYVAEDMATVKLDGWKQIIEVLKSAYADADPRGTARRALIALHQTNKKFESFWAEFHRLSKTAGMNDETTLEYLKDRLSTEIKSQLINVDDTGMDLTTFVKKVQNISTNLDIFGGKSNTNCTNQTFNTNGSKQWYKQTSSAPTVPTITSTVSSPSTRATGTHAGPMDLSFAGRRGLLTPKEKDRRNRLNLCRYCGQAGHIAKDHHDSIVLQAKRRAAGIHELAISSLNVSSPSIVAPGDQ